MLRRWRPAPPRPQQRKVRRAIPRTLTIDIRLEGAAFEDGGEGAEIARILRDYAQRVEAAGEAREGRLRDANGNPAGYTLILHRDGTDE